MLPELVDSGQDGYGSVPDVAGVIDLSTLHLHFCVFQPQRDIPVIHIQRSLVDRPSSLNKATENLFLKKGLT